MAQHWLQKVINRPKQVKFRHFWIVSIFGKIGYFTKAFIYASIGGLTLQSAFTHVVQNESPQGVFILLGSAPVGASHVYLIAIFTGIIVYAIWRFWEGITGQGYDSKYSRKKNFFRYRVSPLASGFVYLVYAVYVVTLFTGSKIENNGSSNLRKEDSSCFPLCWRDNGWGTVGLVVLAAAFTIAAITQLVPAFTGNFRAEIDHRKFETRLGRVLKYPFLISGHVGFFARGMLFFLVCFLFWKIVFGETLFLDPKQATVSQAINGLRENTFGKSVMVILGFGLLIYGVFAALCSYFKIFPTVPPSENITLPDNDIEDLENGAGVGGIQMENLSPVGRDLVAAET